MNWKTGQRKLPRPWQSQRERTYEKKLRDMEDRVTRANKNLTGVPDELKE